jgi:xylem cysteine proteinase/KDEL-tailed cysteine endopeptidase
VDATESALQKALAKYGPITVIIDASDVSFHFYKGGVYTGPCDQPVNHAVLVVGYDTTAAGET